MRARRSRRTDLSRRKVLGAAVGTLALASCRKPAEVAPPAGKPGASLSAVELSICAAACERVLPKDEDAGAAELGVVDYIDRRLARRTRRGGQARRRFRSGLALLDDWSVQEHGKPFVALDPGTQDLALASLAAETTPEGYAFVRQLIELTLEGALADPAHGGNRGRAGWKLTGFEMPCPNASCH